MNKDPYSRNGYNLRRGLVLGTGAAAVALTAWGCTPRPKADHVAANNLPAATTSAYPESPTSSQTAKASSSDLAASSPSSLHFTKVFTEIVQTPDGARTFDGFNDVGEGARVPQGTTVEVGCVAHDSDNQMGSVVDGDYYVFATPPVARAARISPSNSYNNTTNPAILAEPLKDQPVYDKQIPFCTPAEMAGLGLAQ